MSTLQDLIDIEDSKLRFIAIKKAFMPYTQPVEIDGNEKQALIVLLNLSLSKPEAQDWLDLSRAMGYFVNSDNLTTAKHEIKWFHTHNLKFPDCRVSEQRIIAMPLYSEIPTLTSQSLNRVYGWAHNSAVYKHTIWLLNEFRWRGRVENLLNLIRVGEHFWLELLADIGLKPEVQLQIKELIERQLPSAYFPDEVNRYSKQLRFPWKDEYLSVTPVVSHAIQQQLSVLSRQHSCSFHFKTMNFPHSASIGNLCGSLGGNMDILNYPIGVIANRHQTLGASRSRTNRYFDDFQLTSKRTCNVLAHLTGFEQPQTRKAQIHVRQYQLKIIRKQIARWLLPLIELRDSSVTEQISLVDGPDDELVKRFLSINEFDFLDLTTSLNQRLHFALQNNRFASRFAYHPKLMRVLKTELIWVLTQLSRPEPACSATSDSTVQYLYLPSMRVFDAAALSCPYLSGAPSLTAVFGFVHRYQRELRDLLPDKEGKLKFKDFAIFIRDESVQTSAKLTEPSVIAKARGISPVKRTTIIREDCSDLVFDIVITIESDQRLSDYLNQLRAALPTNFAGGTLLQPETSLGIDWLSIFVSESDLFQAVKGLPGYGTWLSPYSFQPQNLMELQERLSNDGSLIPVANGFHFLELPQEREGALTNLHCYAENNIALAKRVSPIEVRIAGRDHFFEQVFWSLEVTEQTILIKKGSNRLWNSAVS
ncbi:hypothetical protein K6U40_13390 [Vibrio fluvialis]|uniref:type I-F CRISPR-associated protein Csy2 n=1 Tax=Vibrio fluvialis TaxID=676 RepID=UPI001C9C73C0|nr:type I-F CRISPR-associated protein Csy2 [Vibrio fluvialis]EKO3436823.1 hypothetical protein [Vibrio fluvialis]MBY7998477.1 hypothetical protein [Vibrio fluvialis]MCG6346481.1 hypothetical protein [Vibrio fluvialis]